MEQKENKKVVIIYDDTRQSYTTGTYCLRALQNICDVVHYLPSQLNDIPKDSFDLYLSIDDGTKYVLPQHLKPSAWWVIDTHMQFDWDREKAYYFDMVFAAQKDGAEKLRRAGVKNVFWLPLACDPEIHAKIDIPKKFDWCFVGHINCKERVELIELLKKRFPNCFVGQAFGKEMAGIFSASRIVFNRSIKNDVNMRVFEALSTGSLLVTNDLKDNGLEELLQEGEDYVAYYSPEELVGKVAYYLEHEGEREKIAGHGRETALSGHTYEHRMISVLDRMKEIIDKGRCSQAERGTSYFQFARPELLELVPEGVRKVLDIGCAAGELGAGIKREHGAEVVGVEVNPSIAEMARQKIDRVVSGDCEQLDFSSIFNGTRFDCVILADILEHLRTPEDLLRKIKPLLGEGACIIASIPNVQNYAVVAGLIEGNWAYQDMGILDRTHLRFFTRREIEKLFAGAGFFIEKMAPKYDPNHYTWLAAGLPNNLTFGRVAVNGLPVERVADFFVFQYLIVARPVESEAGKESVKPLLSW
ncbi:MAG: glycosyltransferase [Thermodesulfobacteriota bacterium]